MPSPAAIALGGNLGNVAETFHRACAAFKCIPDTRIMARSRDYLTQPIGVNAGDPYRNAVVLLEVEQSPLELLYTLQRIETDLGRVRSVHWGPRTLDLDILSYGSETMNHWDPTLDVHEKNSGEPPSSLVPRPSFPRSQSALDTRHWTLLLPHPACWYRRFVLDPWCDVAPDWRHPVLDQTVSEMREQLLRRPLRIGLDDADSLWRGGLRSRIESEFSAAEVNVIDIDIDIDIDIEEIIPSCEIRFERIQSPVNISSGPRSISLENGPNANGMAVQILRAALDEPIPVESATA